MTEPISKEMEGRTTPEQDRAALTLAAIKHGNILADTVELYDEPASYAREQMIAAFDERRAVIDADNAKQDA